MPLNCSDSLSAAVQAILNLGVPSTAAEILPQMQALCPTAGFVLADAEDALATGWGRGVFIQCMNVGDATLRYEINGNMRNLRSGNDVYYQLVDPTTAPPSCSQ